MRSLCFPKIFFSILSTASSSFSPNFLFTLRDLPPLKIYKFPFSLVCKFQSFISSSKGHDSIPFLFQWSWWRNEFYKLAIVMWFFVWWFFCRCLYLCWCWGKFLIFSGSVSDMGVRQEWRGWLKGSIVWLSIEWWGLRFAHRGEGIEQVWLLVWCARLGVSMV